MRIGRDNDFDVVLIDTAGRMQDNEVGFLFLLRDGVVLNRLPVASDASSSQGE